MSVPFDAQQICSYYNVELLGESVHEWVCKWHMGS